MSDARLLGLIIAVAAASYALRVIPLALLRRPLRNPRLVAFIERLPYAILAAMVVPDVFSSLPIILKGTSLLSISSKRRI